MINFSCLSLSIRCGSFKVFSAVMLQKFCGCKLKTGGLIVAWFTILFAVLLTIFLILSPEELFKSISKQLLKEPKQKLKTRGPTQSMEETEKFHLVNTRPDILVVIVTEIVLGVFAILIIVAIKKTRPMLILPWLILKVIYVGIFILVLWMNFLRNPLGTFKPSVMSLTYNCGLGVYVTSGMFSVYKMLQIEEKRKGDRGNVEFQGVSQI